MAEIWAMSPEEERSWRAWVDERPPNIRAWAERFPPNRLFRMKETGQRVTVYSFYEDTEQDGAVRLMVIVSDKFNFVMFPTQVFGIDPEDLEECDLPGDDEAVGAVLENEADI